jgi:hypothetical protein
MHKHLEDLAVLVRRVFDDLVGENNAWLALQSIARQVVTDVLLIKAVLFLAYGDWGGPESRAIRCPEGAQLEICRGKMEVGNVQNFID